MRLLNSRTSSMSDSWICAPKIFLVAMLVSSWSIQCTNTTPLSEDGMVPEFMVGLNSVPRMGRRSLSPFMLAATGNSGGSNKNDGGFRILRNKRRPYNPFGGGFPAFRFVGSPASYQGALRDKRMVETVPRSIMKRGLPPVNVGSAMFPSVRQQQNIYWKNLLNEAARQSLLQRLSGEKVRELEKSALDTNQKEKIDNASDYGSSPLARFLSRYQGSA